MPYFDDGINNFFRLERDKLKILWKSEQENYIVRTYQKHEKTIKDLTKEFCCSTSSIHRVLERHNLLLGSVVRGFPRKSFFFHRIDTAEKAYWLGYLSAKGEIEQYRTHISLQSPNKEHLENFRQALGAMNNKIGERRQAKDKNYVNYRFKICDKQLYADLLAHNCTPHKHYDLKEIPKIEPTVIGDYLRGFLEGTGTFFYDEVQKRLKIRFRGTREFMEEIKSIIGIPRAVIHKFPGDSPIACGLTVERRGDVLQVLAHLYDIVEDPSLCLEDNYNTYLNYLIDWDGASPLNSEN